MEMNIANIRMKYPQYKDMSDADLAGALHQKFYSDMPVDEFNAKIGFSPAPSQEAADLGAAIKENGPVGNKPDQSYTGTVLPFSVDARGNAGFDPNAGILGSIKRAVSAPAEALQGKLDPMSREGIGRALETAALISPTPVAQRAGERALFGPAVTRPAQPKIPTADELKAAATGAYNKVRDMGVDYSSGAVKNWADDIVRNLEAEGRIAELNPKTHALLDKLRNPPENSVVGLQSLDAFRKRLGEIAGSKDAAEASTAQGVIRRLDQFINAADPSSVVARTPAAQAGNAANLPRIGGAAGSSAAEDAARLIKDARGNYAAASRSDAITGIEEAAANRAAAANSGHNLGNTIRGRLATVLNQDGGTRGFSPEEVARIENIVRGTTAMNQTRDWANRLGGGGGLAQSLLAGGGAAVGGAAGGVPGAAIGAAVPAAAGMGLRGIYNNLTSKAIGSLDEALRMRSPLYESRVANPGTEILTPQMRDAIARLVASGYFAPRAWNPRANET